jgi:WD40 repeat protein
MTTGVLIGNPMPGHRDIVDDVAVSSDGKLIVSGSKDATLRFWDADSGQPVGDPLTADSQSVATLVLSADRRILSSKINLSPDETVSAWVWPAPAAWRHDLCNKLSYNMSDRQWSDWVSPDIGYKQLCPRLPKLADDN